jgi:hypothetical protein
MPCSTCDMLRRKRHRPRAGNYAEDRYQRGLAAWRRKTRPIRALLFGPFILGGAAVLATGGDRFSWFAGAITGAFIGLWVAIGETPPRYVETWRDGAEGERKTEKALLPLERNGWIIVHDVQARYGNYDHIAVGPGGVFLVESKNLTGITEIRNGVAVLRRRLDPDAVERFDRMRGRALGAAYRIKEDIHSRTQERVWVQAVVVFWSDFPQGFIEEQRCVYVSGKRLRRWLEERPERLSVDRAAAIGAAIQQLAQEQAAGVRAISQQQ